MQLTHEHDEIYRSLKRFIDREINPNVDEWEKEGAFPAHELFKKMGNAGLLGVTLTAKAGLPNSAEAFPISHHERH